MMLNRIYLNNNEDTHYPLIYGDTGFPDDLISGMSIKSPYPVFLYSVSVASDAVSITLMRAAGDTYKPMGFGTWDKTGHPIASIYSEDTGSVIGWVSFGSGTDIPHEYVGMAEIDPSCVIAPSSRLHSSVNGEWFETPSVLYINTTGCLHYNKGVLSIDQVIDQNNLDGRDPYTYRCLKSVNNKVPEDHTITIKMPKGSFSVTGTLRYSPNIKNPYEDSYLQVLTITINEYNLRSAYGCTEHDPILDKFLPVGTKTYTESPLDTYITKYALNYASSNINDTIIVTSGETTYTMVIPTEDVTGTSWESVENTAVSDAITIEVENGESIVLIKTSSNEWEDS